MAKTIVIVGAGQAAAQAVQTLRSKDATCRIILLGEEDYLPYERPPLSKAFLAGDVDLDKITLRKASYFEDKAVDVRLATRVRHIHREAREVELEDGSRIAYDALILATGSRVRKLPIEGADLPGVHYLRDVADVLGLRPHIREGARIAIVGAGYIGLEVAAVARKHGAEVTVLEAQDRVMSRVAAESVSRFYENVHRDAGVDIRLNVGISRFEGDGRFERVRLADGTAVEADIAVVGIGILPNVELAAEAGLAVDNGIVVDECCRTSDPVIFAAGDCTNHPNPLMGERIRLESVQNAVSQGKTAALAALGIFEPYAEVPWFWSDQYDLKLQIAGLWHPDDEVVLRGDPKTHKFSAVYLRDGKIAAINAINNLKDFLPAKKLIAEGRVVDRERLADPDCSLKDL